MKKLFLTLLLGLTFITSNQSAIAAGPISILNFQVSGIGALGSTNETSFSVHVAWTPKIDLAILGLRGEIGAALLKDARDASYLGTNYEVFLKIGIVPMFGFEIGGGLANWPNSGGSAGIVTGNLVLSLFGTLDRVYVGYSRFFLGSGKNIIKAGIGLAF